MNVLMHRMTLMLVAILSGCSGGSEDRALATSESDALSANAAKTITILHVNDSHSTLDSIGPKDEKLDGTLGGLTRAATVIERIRWHTPGTLFLHAGDAFEGDLTFPATAAVTELRLLRWLGLDAITLGNHEFDYGPDVLANSLEAAGFDRIPVLSANLVKPADPQPLSRFVTGHVVKKIRGVRVGIFGLTTPFDPLAQTGPFTLSSALQEIAAREAAALRSPPANADVVVLLSHLDATVDHEIADVPDNGIDFIVGGHDEFEETFTAYEPGKTMVVRAGHFYQWVGKLEVVVQKGRIVGARHELIPIDGSVRRDPGVDLVVKWVKRNIGDALGFDAFNTAIAFAQDELENEWNESMGARRDLGVGDLAADALKARFDADIGLTTSGFLNDRIYQGPVVANDLFRALPYGINPKMLDASYPDGILPDPVLKVSMTGAQIYTGVEAGISLLGEIPQVSEGVLVCFDASAPPQQRVRFIALGGALILPDATTYSVATNIAIVALINQVFDQLGMEGVAIPDDFDPQVSQFSALVGYATGKTLTLPQQPRVLNTTSCMDLLGP